MQCCLPLRTPPLQTSMTIRRIAPPCHRLPALLPHQLRLPSPTSHFFSPCPLPLPPCPAPPTSHPQKPHKVNLGSPQKTILVNILKGTCGVSVVDRFKELCRYNIRTLVMPEEEREAQKAAQRAANERLQAAQQQPGGGTVEEGPAVAAGAASEGQQQEQEALEEAEQGLQEEQPTAECEAATA